MGYTYITDTRHLMQADPMAELPAAVKKLRDFLGHIIKAASAADEPELKSALPCRKRPNRTRCPGHLLIKRQDVPENAILWHCSDCEDGGKITHWRGTWYDLARHSAAESDPSECELSLILNTDEYQALLGGTLYDPDSERLIYTATHTRSGIMLKGREGDMDNLAGFVACDTNHEENRRRQKVLDSVYAKLSSELEALAFNE